MTRSEMRGAERDWQLTARVAPAVAPMRRPKPKPRSWLQRLLGR